MFRVPRIALGKGCMEVEVGDTAVLYVLHIAEVSVGFAWCKRDRAV